VASEGVEETEEGAELQRHDRRQGVANPASKRDLLASPGISGAPGDQVAFIGDLSGGFHAYRLSDGAVPFAMNVFHKNLASTAVADGMVFFAPNNGLLSALGSDGCQPHCSPMRLVIFAPELGGHRTPPTFDDVTMRLVTVAPGLGLSCMLPTVDDVISRPWVEKLG
jgi:hypothetical protein